MKEEKAHSILLSSPSAQEGLGLVSILLSPSRSDPEKYTAVSFATYPKGRHASADRQDYFQRKEV
jgi:hypothetical protein